MPSKYIKGEFNQLTIAEQIAALNKKAGMSVSGGKVKNIKNAYASAKKKSGTMKTGSQRGS